MLVTDSEKQEYRNNIAGWNEGGEERKETVMMNDKGLLITREQR